MPDGPERPTSPSGIGIGAAPSEPTTAAESAHGLEEAGVSQAAEAWRRFRRHKLAMASAAVLILLSLGTIFAGQIARTGYLEQHLRLGLHSPGVCEFVETGPQGEDIARRRLCPFGTDNLGRDMLARVLYGGRISLAVGVGVALSSGLLGTLLGALAGFYGGKLDNFLMRVTDLFLAMPLLVILIMFSRIFGGGVVGIVLMLSSFFWMPIARIVRGVFMSLKEKEFIEAARAAGASDVRIIVRHMLPNSMGPIVVNVTLAVAAAILTESTLSFLGFGVQPPTPTWGNLLEQGRNLIFRAPWVVWIPGLFILLTVLVVNYIGDGLRDALDPTQRKVRA